MNAATMVPTPNAGEENVQEANNWPPLIRLDGELELPDLNTDLLPPPLRRWICDEAERLGMPAEAVAVPALIAAGTVIGNTLRIHPKARDKSWVETTNLFGLVIAASSLKKSPAVRRGLRFLDDLQKQASARHEAGRHARYAEAKAAEAEAKQIEAALTAAASDEERAEAQQKLTSARCRIEGAQAPGRKYQLNDVTVEKIAILHSHAVNRGGMLWERDEIAGLFGQMKRPGHENDRPFLLEAYDGKKSYDTERVSRAGTFVPTLTLSVVGTIQPSILEPLIRETRMQRRDDGLMERFQLAVWIDASRTHFDLDRAEDEAALEQARAAFESLEQRAQEREARLGAQEFDSVHLSADAQEHFDAWSEARYQESRRFERDGHAAFASHLGKARGTAARLMLILHEIDQADGQRSDRISRELAESATGLMDFFLAHANRTYRPYLPVMVDKLLVLWELIDGGDVFDGVTLRELNRSHQVLGKTVAETRKVLREAGKLGWLRIEKVRNRGAPPSVLVLLHPDLR